MQILMIASENDAIKGAKVGGVADVVRDAPRALVKQGLQVSVVIPDYNYFSDHYPIILSQTFNVPFQGRLEQVVLNKLDVDDFGVTQYVLCHPLFNQGGGVYLNDNDNRPFARDASKYALFNAAVAEALNLGQLAIPDVLHLHDWHSAVTSVLIRFSERYQSLQHIKQVFTVHNIALQGIRPFAHDDSSLETWFPSLSYDGQVICDPRYQHCFNPMRAAINLADKVHVVSDTYAKEILQPSNHQQGYFGGEGLESDLNEAEQQGRLIGIINGCEYDLPAADKTELVSFLIDAQQHVLRWLSRDAQLKTVHYLANERIKQWLEAGTQVGPLVTSIGRLTDQKVLLLRQRTHGHSVMDELLDDLADVNGRMIILGSGDSQIENEFMRLMGQHTNIVFLNGYGQSLSDSLYPIGDLFLMPSSFEPCGISQMLALRVGQPCLVNGVGGLKDTITHMENGFVFNGDSLGAQTAQLKAVFNLALTTFSEQPNKWQQMVEKAKATRFSWFDSANDYINRLYK
ncbi:glycogen synthase [Pseudoalteromonas ulvae]|uniref:starch synthase n=1 Tax=Pseudoalteromonas ulvae TaxID=107327 RepID=A0A244CSF4_PSEDV|nr:glycogen/starch synthase [Pseudoalteromonas ulvae]OUL58169.1 glycogen synthase [Pseudoalteromonas ulvae]